MQRKQGGLVPIGEALADLPGPVQAIQGSAQNRANLYAKRFRSTSIGSQSTGTGSDSSSRRSRAARPPRLSHSSVW